MYVDDELAVSPTLPDDFMEDSDEEDEIVQINVGKQVVKPIVDDLISNLDLQVNLCQKLFFLQNKRRLCV